MELTTHEKLIKRGSPRIKLFPVIFRHSRGFFMNTTSILIPFLLILSCKGREGKETTRERKKYKT